MSHIINYYLIHCDEHIERLEYINNLSNLLNIKLEIFKGFYTKEVSVDYDSKIEYIKNVDSNFNMNKNVLTKPGEIGCYLSHHMLVKYIYENMKETKLDEDVEKDENKYSVIFEDDVIFNENLHEDIINIVKDFETKNIDWDIVFLGNLTKNHGNKIINNIYTIDKKNCCTGTHALLFNNKNIGNVYKSNCNIIHAIDWQYKLNIDNNTLKGYVIYPPLCFQNKNFISNIQ